MANNFSLSGKAALVTGGDAASAWAWRAGWRRPARRWRSPGAMRRKNAAALNTLGKAARAPGYPGEQRRHQHPQGAAGLHAAYPHMRRAGGGKIVNIGSMMSLFGASFVAPYGASKGGIVQLTKALAAAWAKDGIQVNAVPPEDLTGIAVFLCSAASDFVTGTAIPVDGGYSAQA